MARRVNKISIHCSATTAGSAVSFDNYHRNHNGWNSIGYHFVIGNGVINGDYIPLMDGMIEQGRSLDKTPAAVRGENGGMIAICLIGSQRADFTEPQFESLRNLLKYLMDKYDLEPQQVKGHNEYKGANKACPCFNVRSFMRI